ncbi:DNase I-like protein, partial [Atractiella rhizophila]
MKLMTWNINGLKTLPYYHPWSEYFKPNSSYEGIIANMNADIVCVQETKMTRKQVERNMCIMNEFDCFYSFYSRVPVKGYSGTGIYTKKSTVVPVKAEEGLSGRLKTVAALSDSSKILPHPSLESLDLTFNEILELDCEGRCTMVDLSLFVLINLYCPNETNDDRLEYKNRYESMLESRVRGLMKAGREVVVVGDMNICHRPLDHCDPEGRMKEHGITDWYWHPSRRWLDNLINENGILIDICRKFHPDREKMFTCWNTKIDARASNYGTRIDYILVTHGLLPWIDGCDILPNIKGSDHCPVVATFREEIQVDGQTFRLWDQLNPSRAKDQEVEPPPLAAKFYQEFKQGTLTTFFNKKAESSLAPEAADSRPPSSTDLSSSAVDNGTSSALSQESSMITVSSAGAASSPVKERFSSKKRKSTSEAERPSSTNSKKKKNKSSVQPTLANFFTTPATK